MSIDFTVWAIRLLLINTLVIAFGIVQHMMKWNVFPKALESTIYGLVLCFEAYVITFFFISFIFELWRIARSLARIEKAIGGRPDV